MNISIIVAIANNYAIGKNNELIYHLSNDMKKFKFLTQGNTVIMGRKTFESLPKGALPYRRNIVLTKHPETLANVPNIDIFTSLEEALKDCKDRFDKKLNYSDEVFIIGGSSVYDEAISIADKMFITKVHDTPEDADTFFPEFDLNDWHQVSIDKFDADDKNKFSYDFIELERNVKKPNF